MKYFYALFLLIIIQQTAFAQFPGGAAQSTVTGRISGTIIDSITKKPVDYATLSLSRSGQTKATNGSLTDDRGVFKIDNIKPGKYRLTISFIGYQTKIIDPVTTTPAKPDLNLGNIILAPNTKLLGEVTIEGQASLVENKIDKIVYNAEKDVTAAGGNATDVLRKVPLLSVDYEGNVSLRGNSNVRVLINGKPSGVMATNMGDALKAIPADQIKNVEVITSPSAKYDAEGSSGIINIITKKNNLEGLSGSINSSVGTRQNNANFNLNAKKGRFGLTTNIGGNYSWPAISRINFASSGAQFLSTSIGESQTERLAGNGSVGVDYDFNTYNSINSTLKFNRFTFSTDGDNDVTNTTSLASSAIQAYTRTTDNQFGAFNYDWNNDFTHKFKKQGQEYSIAAQYTRGKSQNDYVSIFSNNPLFEETSNDGINEELTFQADYTHPFKKVTWEVGAKSILRDISSDSRAFNVSQANGQSSPIINRTNVYNYFQDVYAGYSTFAFTLAKKYGFKLGGRYEHTAIDGDGTPANLIPAYSNNYGTFVPSVVVSRSFKNFQTVKLSYNKRIQRPSLFYLNPFRNAADSLNQSQGNPSLSPEISHNFELGYSTFVKTTVINASVFYRRSNDVIESIIRPTTENGRTFSLQSFENIGTNNSFGFNFFGSINPVKKLTLRTNLNINTYDINVTGVNASSPASSKVYLLYNAFVSASVNLPKDFIIESFVILNSPRRTFQGENAGFNMWITGFKKEIFKKKGSLGITVIDPFNERKNFKSNLIGNNITTNSRFSLPFRSFGVNFSWRFGSLKATDTSKKGVKNDDLKQGENGGGLNQ